jgi:heat shock protein HslJ
MKWIFVIMVVLLAACVPVTGPEPAPPPEELELEGTRWQLETLNGAPVVSGTTITLQFDADGRAGGNAGCNSYGGEYTLEGNSIAFDEIVRTLMACLNDGIMEQEDAYLQALDNAQMVSLGGDRMTISHDGGELNFVRAAE